MNKISIRFFDDREVRAIWDEGNSKWWYSVLDIVGVLNAQDDYAKNRNYWKYLKSKLKKDGVELVSDTNQFKLRAPDGKMRLTDVLDASGVIELAKNMRTTRHRDSLSGLLTVKIPLTERAKQRLILYSRVHCSIALRWER